MAIMMATAVPPVRAQQKEQWLVRPQRLCDCVLAYLAHHWPALPAHSLVSFRDFPPDTGYILGFGRAINVHYNDNTIRTAFSPSGGDQSPPGEARLAPAHPETKIIPRDALAAVCDEAF
jgi:hypothetical protein